MEPSPKREQVRAAADVAFSFVEYTRLFPQNGVARVAPDAEVGMRTTSAIENPTSG